MIIRERYTKPLTSGAASWNTNSDLRGQIAHISVNPSVSTTTFDFRITDDAGTTVYYKKGLKGQFFDDSKIGVYGIYTLGIESASNSSWNFITTVLWREDENP